jgi:prepilin-type N-terminal cleavage/methylation domain-containing protein/prepilin-type processing-associated H-X9-DG protein
MSRRHAFTLIELLVVVAIIALLMAILMPSLRQAKLQAGQVKCLANLHQIGAGLMTYTTENRDFYTPKRWMRGGGASVYSWLGQSGKKSGYHWRDKHGTDNRWLNRTLVPERLGPKDPFPLAECPTGEDQAAYRDPGPQYSHLTNYVVFGTSYGSNHAGNISLLGEGWASLSTFDDNRGCVKTTDIARPALLIAAGEDGAFGNAWRTYQRPRWHGRPDQFNVTFADGHSEFLVARWGEPIGADYRFVEPERMPDWFDPDRPYWSP